MARCTYCGKEYPGDASVCPVDGQPLQTDIALPPTEVRSAKHLLRWKPASISLIILTVLYWFVGLLNLSLVLGMQQRVESVHVKYLLWGSFWNFIIGGLCLLSRRLIKSSGKRRCMVAALALGAALLIVGRNLLMSMLTGRSAYPVLEALLICPWLIYAMLYAVSMVQKRTVADPTPAHGGDTGTPAGDSGIAEEPPSVG